MRVLRWVLRLGSLLGLSAINASVNSITAAQLACRELQGILGTSVVQHRSLSLQPEYIASTKGAWSVFNQLYGRQLSINT